MLDRTYYGADEAEVQTIAGCFSRGFSRITRIRRANFSPRKCHAPRSHANPLEQSKTRNKKSRRKAQLRNNSNHPHRSYSAYPTLRTRLEITNASSAGSTG